MDKIGEKYPQDQAVAEGVLFTFVGYFMEEVLWNKDLGSQGEEANTRHVVAEREKVAEYGESLVEVSQSVLLVPVEDDQDGLEEGL